MATDRTGHCMCGAVSFTAVALPDTFSICHCKTCQRWVGAAFRGVSVATENLAIEGREHIRVFQSSSFAERANCARCGSALWYRLTAGPYVGKTSLAVGLLDKTDGLKTSHEYFVDRKDSTYAEPEGRKQLTEADVRALIAGFETSA